jgi:hypothetical protein
VVNTIDCLIRLQREKDGGWKWIVRLGPHEYEGHAPNVTIATAHATEIAGGLIERAAVAP